LEFAEWKEFLELDEEGSSPRISPSMSLYCRPNRSNSLCLLLFRETVIVDKSHHVRQCQEVKDTNRYVTFEPNQLQLVAVCDQSGIGSLGGSRPVNFGSE
jgi:hypothetical protein